MNTEALSHATRHPLAQPHSRPTAGAEQAAFRAVLQALSYPGRLVELATAAGPAWWQVLTCLVDAASDLADPQGWLKPPQRLALGARHAEAHGASHVLMPAHQAPDFTPRLGSLESPEQGATVLLLGASLGEGQQLELSGPGIAHRQTVALSGVHPAWWQARQQWNAGFPMGVDFLLADSHRVLALPRTTRLALAAAHSGG